MRTRFAVALIVAVAMVASVQATPAVDVNPTPALDVLPDGMVWNIIEWGGKYSARYPQNHWVWDVAEISGGVGCGFAAAGLGPVGAIIAGSVCSWGIGE